MTNINHDGKILSLEQDAFAENCPSGPCYIANATDENGNRYIIRWEIINHETENEDETCNWDDFKVEAN